ncbi:MAG TPA: protoheme IX farnesyltransferase, partial [Thermoanaerobaculia bacterium]|nr:protoheme IX farnesyltransferase [Thermoanaerobaculia bacterium]
VTYLAIACNALAAVLAAITVAIYIFGYTPLKRTSTANTAVGAIPGAIPPVIGWVAGGGSLTDAGAVVLFGILFLWQMPHFLAIAWLCRADYAAAGFPMLTVRDPQGTRTARQAILYGAALVPVSLLPAALGVLGSVYLAGALALSLAYLGFGFAFARNRSTPRARGLMLASIAYLPVLLILMLLDRVVH